MCRPERLARVGLLLLALLSPACRQDMFNQPKARTYRASDFFDDGAVARAPVPGTVARGQLHDDTVLHTGVGPDGRFTDRLPLRLDRPLLARGRERYDIYCAPCHARSGDGRGMIVERGFKEPPTLHSDRLRGQPLGYFFDVMRNGFGEMPAYASQIGPEDRWAIAVYIRALQLSQHAPAASLPALDRERLESAGDPGGEAR